MLDSLKAWQIRIVVVGWVTYASYYFGRVNLSTAIPEIKTNLLLTSQQLGLLGTGFFLTYAIGQMFSGYLGDRISPRRLVFAGMLLSGLMNLLFAATNSWTVMFVAWTLNGASQSTGWAPVIKVLSNWHRPDQRRKVAGIFATSYVAGNAVTWTLTGWIIVYSGWRAAFWIPAFIMWAMALVWFMLVRDDPAQVGLDEQSSASASHKIPNILHNLKRFWPLAVAAVTSGFILFSLVIWLPTYLVENLAASSGAAASLSSVLPIAGVLGTIAVSWLISGHFAGRELHFGAALYSCASLLLAFFPFVGTSVISSLVILILCGGILYGAATIITTIVPMLMSRKHETSTIAGFIDFAFNVGAGMAGVVIGTVLDRHSWAVVFFALAGGGVITGCFLFGFSKWEKKLERSECKTACLPVTS
ncbi:MAG: MFS transporter [Desulfobacterales bacterium]|jgi:OPA family glycerol-3-phosphate transporter-like MFS transporter|nr:MFS transporter [Desulfobacterales bacterium]